MARIRSPNYPSMGLPEAISKVGNIFAAEQHLTAPREVMAAHMGYKGLNGSSLKALSALLKYGLLEKTKDDKRKVTQLAIQILHPETSTEREEAIRKAALHPSLFREIAEQWPTGIPSDENLKAYLIRRQFHTDAIKDVISSYRETMELVAKEGPKYAAKSLLTEEEKAKKPETPKVQASQDAPRQSESAWQRASGAEPFRVSFTGSGIEIAGRITDAESADELVRAVNALKLLLRPVGEAKRPDQPLEDEEPED